MKLTPALFSCCVSLVSKPWRDTITIRRDFLGALVTGELAPVLQEYMNIQTQNTHLMSAFEELTSGLPLSSSISSRCTPMSSRILTAEEKLRFYRLATTVSEVVTGEGDVPGFMIRAKTTFLRNEDHDLLMLKVQSLLGPELQRSSESPAAGHNDVVRVEVSQEVQQCRSVTIFGELFGSTGKYKKSSFVLAHRFRDDEKTTEICAAQVMFYFGAKVIRYRLSPSGTMCSVRGCHYARALSLWLSLNL